MDRFPAARGQPDLFHDSTQQMSPSAGTRAVYTHDTPDDRELTWWGGIVSATVSDYAAAIGCDPAAIVEAVEEGTPSPYSIPP